MNEYLVLDIETKFLSTEVEGGWNNIPAFGLAVAVTMHHDGMWNVWLENDATALIETLEATPLIVTFNGIRFDYEVLRPYGLEPELFYPKSFDILAEMQKVLGHRVSLDSVARATLGRRKSGEGLKAVKWFRNGEIAKVIEYCKQDVELTKDLYEFAKKNGHLWFNSYKTAKTKCPLEM